MKKLFLSVFLLIFLVSCWDDTWDTALILYENNNFSMNIPSNWKEIKKWDDILPTASVGDIELAASAENTTVWFANNLVILSTELNKLTTSTDYSMLNNLWAETDYLEYLKLWSKEISFPDWENSILYEFEAKYNYESPKLKFLQTAHICNKTKWYLITVAIPTSVTDVSRYVDFISSFSCK